MQNPSKMRKAQEEIDGVLGQNLPTFESLKKLEWVIYLLCAVFHLSHLSIKEKIK